MTDDEYWPPRLIVRKYNFNPADRTTWIKVEGFRTMNLGIEEGDPLYVLTENNLDRHIAMLNNLRMENATLRNDIKEYKRYFELQKKLSKKEADDAQR